MTNLQEIKGHEELHKMSVGPNWTSPEDIEEYNAMSQTNPRVLVIGAGHSALALSARLKQLGVPTLMVDKLPRVGDSWRLRYMNLSLHDPTWENHMPYLKFPDTFPAWIPRKQIADWLEHYQSIMQLPAKLGSTVTGAKWDEEAKLWTVEIEKDGSKTYLKPAHIVLATGLHSDVANIPEFEGTKDFQGPIIHSTQYTTASDIPGYTSKKFIVIGSSASAHDIAQDLAKSGVDVTMVQRDANCVYSLNSKVHIVGASFMKPGITTEVSCYHPLLLITKC
jgi:putative flavoprotein involved in K+ transport